MKYIKLFEKFNEASFDNVVERKEKPGPDAYETGLDDEEVEDKKDQMKKQAKMGDDDSAAYKEMPGDDEARESGKVKTSKHVKSYHELYGDGEANESVKTTSLKRYKELKKKGIAVELVTKADLNDKKNETLSESDRVYIDFLNKDKRFKQDRKYFKSWEDAIKWGRSEFDRFSPDMIKYESFQLDEGTMSDIHQLAGEVKSEDEFVKKFFKEYGAKIKKSSDSVEWVKSLYKDTVDESIVNEDEEKPLPPEVERWIEGRSPEDVSVDEIKDSKGNTWVVHVEGFTDDCQSDEAYCEDPDAVIDEVWSDHEQRQGKKAYEQLIAGDGEYPIVVSIFRK